MTTATITQRAAGTPPPPAAPVSRTAGAEMLADRQAIGEQLARYAYAFDSHDAQGWAAIFTDDGVFEVRLGATGQPLFRAQGTEQLREFARSAPQMLHHFSNLVFEELSADSASTRAMVVGTWVPPEDGNPAIYTHGTYEQRWAKAGGTWRLAHQLFLSAGYHSAALRAPTAPTVTEAGST